ncbi:hypothetical protein K2173_020009 [Erythroxylum novogranatense]|uniref:RNA helicase n=1 Tax=Erythroxylum novogranatense TaxID=1862640 RepID=A0AAV8UAL6_9ROSI|nr:hypothetical protein K2173_020009 [Erythroxylum novogranatense]
MARGQLAFLLRMCASKNSISRAKFLVRTQNFVSLREFDNWVLGNKYCCASSYGGYRQFSTKFVDLFASEFGSKNPRDVGTYKSVDERTSSSSIQDGDEKSNEYSCSSNSSVTVVESVEFEDVLENRVEGGICEVNEGGITDLTRVTVGEENNSEGVLLKEKVGKVNVAFRDPIELYQELCNAQNKDKLKRSDWQTIQDVFFCFGKSGWAANQALAVYIGMSFFPTAVSKFCDFFSKRSVKFLFPIFVEYCIEEFPGEIRRFKSMIESADLTKPHTWFPFARAMKRKIIYHCGPTNSGKTYNALQRFMEAKKGIYCSPLRLLAMEVFDKVNALGVYCSLLTGQEKKKVPFSNHVACTVEMVSSDELYDVAVIDEIQMMADPYRGYAWTRALLGLKADEIHLCGDPSVLNIVRMICLETGDELYEQHYDRFKPLVVEAKTLLGDLRNVLSGDCIVAFSRREIFEFKMAIEKYTKHRCCVIYGALPPETRRQQASLFNDQDNEFDVLVASDAVGMGLNLNIKRVVFNTLSKYNGDKNVPVPASQVKQIAGRAGRRGSRYPEGLTTTLQLEDLDYLIECLKQPFDEVKKMGLFPFFEQVELFAGKLPNVSFSRLLEKFSENCRLDGSYFLCKHDHIKKIANMLEKIQGLSLEDRFYFCFAPVNIRDPKAMHHLLRFASVYRSAKNDEELLDLESKHQVLSAYLWLSNQFKEGSFPYAKKVEAMATDIAELLGQSLVKACWKLIELLLIEPCMGF